MGFASTILGLNLYGIATNSYYVQLMINTEMTFLYARIALVIILFTYVFAPSLRTNTTKALTGTSGVLLMLIGLLSVGSPSLLGYVDTYILLGDSLILFEAGVLLLIVSIELPTRTLQPAGNTYAQASEPTERRPRVRYSAPTRTTP